MRTTWGEAARGREHADAAQKALERRGRQGQSRPGQAAPLNRLWGQAERHWDHATAAETAWNRGRSAFARFTADGRLNDRTEAEATVAAA